MKHDPVLSYLLWDYCIKRDDVQRLVIADYLEEKGDVRAEAVRFADIQKYCQSIRYVEFRVGSLGGRDVSAMIYGASLDDLQQKVHNFVHSELGNNALLYGLSKVSEVDRKAEQKSFYKVLMAFPDILVPKTGDDYITARTKDGQWFVEPPKVVSEQFETYSYADIATQNAPWLCLKTNPSELKTLTARKAQEQTNG